MKEKEEEASEGKILLENVKLNTKGQNKGKKYALVIAHRGHIGGGGGGDMIIRLISTPLSWPSLPSLSAAASLFCMVAGDDGAASLLTG